MSLDRYMVSIYPNFTIKYGEMDQWIALLGELLVIKKANEPYCLFSISLNAGKKFISKRGIKR